MVLITAGGITYAALGVATVVILYWARNEMCNASDDRHKNEDCPHPSVSDVEHSDNRQIRMPVLAVCFTRIVVCSLLLLKASYFYCVELGTWIRTRANNRYAVKQGNVDEVGEWTAPLGLFCLLLLCYVCCDVAQLLIPNTEEGQRATHNFFVSATFVLLILTKIVYFVCVSRLSVETFDFDNGTVPVPVPAR